MVAASGPDAFCGLEGLSPIIMIMMRNRCPIQQKRRLRRLILIRRRKIRIKFAIFLENRRYGLIRKMAMVAWRGHESFLLIGEVSEVSAHGCAVRHLLNILLFDWAKSLRESWRKIQIGKALGGESAGQRISSYMTILDPPKVSLIPIG